MRLPNVVWWLRLIVLLMSVAALCWSKQRAAMCQPIKAPSPSPSARRDGAGSSPSLWGARGSRWLRWAASSLCGLKAPLTAAITSLGSSLSTAMYSRSARTRGCSGNLLSYSSRAPAQQRSDGLPPLVDALLAPPTGSCCCCCCCCVGGGGGCCASSGGEAEAGRPRPGPWRRARGRRRFEGAERLQGHLQRWAAGPVFVIVDICRPDLPTDALDCVDVGAVWVFVHHTGGFLPRRAHCNSRIVVPHGSR
mmetsp:Transcript_11459/g.33277  ORF Transcript_11459/g.33277 Transcript_11459/m.33277 type:complete len:250 (-) Transcript_11459:352-1101(-)